MFLLTSFILRIDFKFSGDSSNVIDKGDSNHYPSYITDRVYYKSRLIPVNEETKGQNYFNPIRIREADYIESDKSSYLTSTIFEELDHNKISKELCGVFGREIFNISTELYPFIAYDYFTACFNVIYPNNNELKQAVEIFEPLFFLLYSKYIDVSVIADYDIITDIFIKELNISDKELLLSDDFNEKIMNYFKRFSLHRDDELTLKGWWKFIME